jgi:Predicted nucleotidyltransferases
MAVEQDIDLAHRIIRRHLPPEVADLYLFGSRARGKARRFSDIDVAVRAKCPLPPGLLAEVREELEQSNCLLEVDLVDLSEAGEALIAAVNREGIPWND